MTVYIASDHAGYPAKRMLVKFLESSGYTIHDFGTHNEDSVDYPDYAVKVARMVGSEKESRGILICGTGIGMCIVANKIRGIRAALCNSVEVAILSRRHNNSNILCLGGRITPISDIREVALAWLKTEFEGGRHQHRLDLISSIED